MSQRGWPIVGGTLFGVGTAIYTAVAALTAVVFTGDIPGIRQEATLTRLAAPRRNLPFPSSQLVFSKPEFDLVHDAWRGQTTAGIAAYATLSSVLRIGAESRAIRVAVVSPNFLSLLGVARASGAIEWRNEDQADIVISDELALRLWGETGQAVGHSIVLNGVERNVQGVTRNFRGIDGEPLDAFVTFGSLRLLGVPVERLGPNSKWIRIVLRVPDGLSRVALRGFLAARLKSEPVEFESTRLSLEPLNLSRGPERARSASILLVGALTAAALLALLVSNIAQLLLLRMVSRAHELSVRLVLGGTPWRIAKSATADAAIALTIGGAVGVMVGMIVLTSQSWTEFGVSHRDIRVPSVVWASLAAMVLLSGLCALVPGFIASARVDMRQLLETARRGSVQRSRFLAVLLATQVGLGSAILVVTAVCIDALRRADETPYGYDVKHLFSIVPALSYSSPSDSSIEKLATSLRSHLWIQAVSEVATVPTKSNAFTEVFVRDHGKVVTQFAVEVHNVDSAYFSATRLPLHLADNFTMSQWRGPDDIVVLSRLAQQRLFSARVTRSACVSVGGPDAGCLRVVGIADDANYMGLSSLNVPAVYQPLGAVAGRAGILVRVASGNAEELAQLNSLIALLGNERVPMTAQSVQHELDTQVAALRRAGALMTALSGAALLVAIIGVAVTTFGVVRARHFAIAIKIALGGTHARVTTSELSRVVITNAIGIVLGSALAGFALWQLAPGVLRMGHLPPMAVAVAMALAGIGTLVGMVPAILLVMRTAPFEVLKVAT